MITYSELKRIFYFIEQSGFKLIAERDGLFYTSSYHRIRLTTLERASTVSIDVTLTALPKSYVDAYSIAGFCVADKLNAFLGQPVILTDQAIAEFLAARLSGDCGKIFERTTTSEWMELHQYHRCSLKRRNKSFWAKVSGLNELYPENEIAVPPSF